MHSFDRVRRNFDVVAIGNAKIDLFLSIHEANKHLRLNTQTNELCFHSGEKITVDKCNLSLGGNAANVTVGLSYLGAKTSIYTEIGDDEVSHKIINTLKKESVNTANIIQATSQRSSVSVIISFKNDRTVFSEHMIRQHDFSFDNLHTKWVYLTSLGEEWKKAYERVVNFAKKTNTPLAFNPGTIQINDGYENIAKVLDVTNILFVNKEEAAKLTNYGSRIMNQEKNKETIKLLLEKLQKLGPKVVVVTDGENGSYAIDEKKNVFNQSIIKAQIVEKTGAGDAYSSGFMSAILRGISVKDAMLWGTLNAASVIEKLGAQNGLLRKEEMEKKLKRL